MNPAAEPQKRARLVDALVAHRKGPGGAEPNISAAAKAVGYAREHVSRLWNGEDPHLRLEVEARRSKAAAAPAVAQAPGAIAKTDRDELAERLVGVSRKALARLDAILSAETDGEIIDAHAQVKAAKVVLDLATAPAAKITARSAGPGGQVAELTASLTPEQLAHAAKEMFGS